MELSTTMANISITTGNESGNITLDDSSKSIMPEQILFTYVLPIIIFVGLKGNIVSIIIFLKSWQMPSLLMSVNWSTSNHDNVWFSSIPVSEHNTANM
jgi:hypothetical protein